MKKERERENGWHFPITHLSAVKNSGEALLRKYLWEESLIGPTWVVCVGVYESLEFCPSYKLVSCYSFMDAGR